MPTPNLFELYQHLLEAVKAQQEQLDMLYAMLKHNAPQPDLQELDKKLDECEHLNSEPMIYPHWYRCLDCKKKFVPLDKLNFNLSIKHSPKTILTLKDGSKVYTGEVSKIEIV